MASLCRDQIITTLGRGCARRRRVSGVDGDMGWVIVNGILVVAWVVVSVMHSVWRKD